MRLMISVRVALLEDMGIVANECCRSNVPRIGEFMPTEN